MSGDCGHGWGYHSQGASGPCDKCEEERKRKVPPADLRERLMALAAESRKETGDVFGEWDRLAIAAYKMAIEDAARACDDIAGALPRRTRERTEAFRCAAAVRALAEGLE